MGKNLTISGFSTALFSTWYFCDEMGMLFDCGDGLSAGLLQKSRKIKHVFISHADRDHLGGLFQFLQLNGRPDLKVYYPKDCGSFPFLAEFSAKFDPHVGGTKWIPLDADATVPIRNDLAVRTIENRHVPTDDSKIKSLTYIVESISHRLKAELEGKPGYEIAELRKIGGNEVVSDIFRSPTLIYSGDTPIENDGRYQDAKVLIHEATFLTTAEIDPDNPKRNKHSSLQQVIEMATDSTIEHLILGHFSSRYSHEQIETAVRAECIKFNLKAKVSLVLPGQIARDILKQPFTS